VLDQKLLALLCARPLLVLACRPSSLAAVRREPDPGRSAPARAPARGVRLAAAVLNLGAVMG